nr:NFACT RNA binding domain-containing protein [Desulfurococcales archaeon]
EELRRAAERAASMYEALESLIECFEAARGHGLDPSRECEGILAYEPERARFLVEVGGTRFWVVSGESPDKVIVRLYREAGEAEAKARRAARAKEELLDKLRAAELKAAARRIQEKARGRKRWWFERYHWTITRGGLIAIGGRDAGQNESIVRRYLEDRDVFLHAEIHGGSAVVLKTGGREPSPGDLEDAAVLAVAYSKAWKSGLGSLQAYWVLGSQVSKSPPSGEYLARGAFMVYGRKNYLKPIQLRLSIGIALATDGAPVVFVGSREASEAYTIGYAVIAPGDSRVEECAADIKKGLVEAFPEELKPLAMAVDETEIASRLPGRCTLLRVATRRGGPPGRLPVVS